MKRAVLALAALLLVMSGVAAYRTIDGCEYWQERYRRFLYSEMMKISPVIYTPDMIEERIGERPPGCDRPAATLNRDDLQRYRREGVGPNEFVEE
jgi:hypothetical protein